MKVMIVEDEYLVRIGLCSMIKWEEYGFELVADAQNGTQALNYYNQFKPDIIITDIELPQMSGLELIENIQSIDRSVKFVIISCHSDFKYAKKAISLGVSHYFEKSEMGPQELIEILLNIKSDFDTVLKNKKNMELSKDSSYEFSTKLSTELSAESYLLRVTTALAQDDQTYIEETLDFRSKNYCFAFLSWSKIRETNINHGVVSNLIHEMSLSSQTITSIKLPNNVFFLLCQGEIASCSEASIIQLSQRIIKNLESISGGKFNIIYSEQINNMTQAFEQYKLLVKTVPYMVFMDNKKICHVVELAKRVDENYLVTTDYQSLYHYLRTGQVSKIVAEVNQIIEKSTVNSIGLINLYGQCNQLVSLLNRAIHYYETFFSSTKGNIYFEYDFIREMYSISDIKNWLIDKFTFIATQCGRLQFYNGDNELIIKAIGYIIAEHTLPISLDDVASKVGISKVYMSQLFKKETEQNFVDILNHVRIEHSKLLLMETNKMIYEISEDVGYGDQSSYYVRVFKSVVGMTPSEYRKEL